MKKISENYRIILEESGPTGRYEVIDLIVFNHMNVTMVGIEAISRRDTLNGQIAFFRAVLAELERFRDEKNNDK